MKNRPGANTVRPTAVRKDRRYLGILTVLALASCLAYAAIAVLSRQFVDGRPDIERPLLTVLGLLGVAFACYLAAIATAVRARDNRRLLGMIVGGSVVFRLTMLGSWPIQEVDIYRYLWDGAATVSGVSPFRYSPQQVLRASTDDELPEDLRRLVALRDGSPAMATILSRVHFQELPTIYPPASQAVFAMTTRLTPRGATVFQRLVAMKACFLLFDLATLALVIGLLRVTGRHVGWSVAYGWCPLLIKEFSNSGHLDAVAVFLTTLAVWLTVRTVFPRQRGAVKPRATAETWLAAGVLGLAVGAKLYPVVLAPWFAAAWIRRLGWLRAAGPASVFALTTAAVLWPMMPTANVVVGDVSHGDKAKQFTIADGVASHNPATDPQDPSLGLKTFLRRWEMNDWLFMLLSENVRPQSDTPPGQRPWFSVVPEDWRPRLLEAPAAWLQVKPAAAAFLITRLVTGGVFLVLAVVLASVCYDWRAARPADRIVWLRAAFLTLAWFWLLCPTQNPWYWAWAMPLVMFARSRAWLALSGLALIYYLRFWLASHCPVEPVLGTGYPGEMFFDLVVTWLEFGPWFVWLAISGWRQRR